ncbi:cation:proton antiporter, partial [Streptomyces roseochromogenus]
VLAVAAADAMEGAGMTAIIGAVLAGLALPDRADGPWATAVASVARWGRALLPVFFVVSGLTVLTKGLSGTSVTLVVLTLLLGTVGKAGGGYAGARLAGHGRLDSLRVGALMNTRGLTELIALQVGVSAGILTPPVYLAYLVMALASTALTGPGLQLIDRAELRRDPLLLAAPGSVEARASAKGDLL